MSAASNALGVNVAVYIRLSKEDISGKRRGIESCAVQLRDAQGAILREGWILDERHVFMDDGASGTKVGRAGWQAMLAAAKRREFDIIVVRDLDRFSRLEPTQTLSVIRELADVGVKLWSYREAAIISVDGDHVVLTALRARQAAAEAEKASERISDALRARAREGRATQKPPFGYRTLTVTEQDVRDGSRLRPGRWFIKHDAELIVVQHIIDVFLETESLTATAHRLNADGTRAPKGGGWGAIGSVKSLLCQPLYRGYRLHKGERIDHPDLAILTAVEVAQLDAALGRASRNRPWSKAERKAGHFNLAVPFIACGVCGRGISATGSGSKRMYVCDSHRLGACRGIGYRSAARVDEAIVKAVVVTLTPETVAAVCALARKEFESRPKTRENDRERLAREIASTEKRIGNLTEAVAEAPSAVRGPLFRKLGAEQERLAMLQSALARLDGMPRELDDRRTIANIEKRANELRGLLKKGGREAAAAIRAVLGNKRLRAHLVSVNGNRGWKLTGRVGGFYVLDDVHHGSDNLLKAAIKGTVVPTAPAPPNASAPRPVSASPVTPAPSAGNPPPPGNQAPTPVASAPTSTSGGSTQPANPAPAPTHPA